MEQIVSRRVRPGGPDWRSVGAEEHPSSNWARVRAGRRNDRLAGARPLNANELNVPCARGGHLHSSDAELAFDEGVSSG